MNSVQNLISTYVETQNNKTTNIFYVPTMTNYPNGNHIFWNKRDNIKCATKWMRNDEDKITWKWIAKTTRRCMKGTSLTPWRWNLLITGIPLSSQSNLKLRNQKLLLTKYPNIKIFSPSSNNLTLLSPSSLNSTPSTTTWTNFQRILSTLDHFLLLKTRNHVILIFVNHAIYSIKIVNTM